MNYEQLLEFLRQNGGSRSIDTPAEAFMRGITAGSFDDLNRAARPEYQGFRSIDTPAELKRRMGSLVGNRYGSRSIDTQAENSLLWGALSGLYSPSMAMAARGILGNQNSTQAILRSILGQE